MIVTDLDSTLLMSDKTISQFTIDTFKECQGRGIKVAFATARSLRSTIMYADDIPADALIYHNGSMASVGGMEVYNGKIPYDDCMKVILALKLMYPNRRMSCEIDDIIYANFDVSIVAANWGNVNTVETDFTDIPKVPLEKIIIQADDDPSILRDIKKILPEYLYAEILDEKYIFIMHENTNKSRGILAVCDKFGIDIGDVVCFGDGNNDIGMLRTCGVGVAMSNGNPAVKQVADEICGDNDSDGMAIWIRENIL